MEIYVRYEILSFLNDEEKQLGRLPSVALIGYGKTNRAVLDIIKDKYPTVIRNEKSIPNIKKHPPIRSRLIIGDNALHDIGEDIAFVSPSVRRSRLSFRGKARTYLLSDTEIFFQKERKNVFLVTGSDGKSTVTAIAGELLRHEYDERSYKILQHKDISEEYGKEKSTDCIFVGGNIGTPLASADISATSAYVIELSSFNLMYTEPASERAVITNISENHLDWHLDMREYIEAKMNIAKNSGGLVTDVDCQIMSDISRELCLFCAVSDKQTHFDLMHKYNTLHTVVSDGNEIYVDGQGIISVNDIAAKERHNIKNLMLAIGLTLGHVDHTAIENCARNFRGLHHRCEHFLTADGIDFINSSIDTTPVRTASTLEALGKAVKILMGGHGKGLSLSPIREPLRKYAKKISLYADEGKRIAEMCDGDEILSKKELGYFPDFESAAMWLTDGTQPSDTVILSPAATSYGEFSSFEERGDSFKKIIKKRFKIQ